jgi:hypothetical protein
VPFVAAVVVLVLQGETFLFFQEGTDTEVGLQFSLVADGDGALFGPEGTARGHFYGLDFQRFGAAVRTSIVCAFGHGGALEAEKFVAWSFAANWLGAVDEADGASIFVLFVLARSDGLFLHLELYPIALNSKPKPIHAFA